MKVRKHKTAKRKKSKYQTPLSEFDKLMIKQANDEIYVKKKKQSPYKKYLLSRAWKRKRDKVLKRANYKCQICKTRNAWQVHHKTYKRIFKERLSDLVAICGVCHQGEHDLLTDEQVEIAVLELIKSEGYE